MAEHDHALRDVEPQYLDRADLGITAGNSATAARRQVAEGGVEQRHQLLGRDVAGNADHQPVARETAGGELAAIGGLIAAMLATSPRVGRP